jgi:hypothetical protein
MRTAMELTGLNEARIRRWAVQGKLRIYSVEGVARPRYDLQQLQALARGEPPLPPGGGLRGQIDEAVEQLSLALEHHNDEFLQAKADLDARTAAAARALVALLRPRLGHPYRAWTWPRAA